MNQALINRIEHAIAEQLKTALDDIITGVMEDQLECYDFDTQDDAKDDALTNFEADIDQLAENVTESIRAQMVQRIEDVTTMALETFTHTALPAVKAKYEQDGNIDRPARREEWCNWVDYLNKSGRISDYEAANIDADVESL
tara:strand:+ start:391 stop:816 length:426 start_codon:yes stop_codon:yes gene_type:complete